MFLRSWFRRGSTHRRRQRHAASALQQAPLREFVYLDAVSLHSLLVSQKSTILEQVSEAVSRAEEAELGAKISADAVVGKGEVASRYQTTNSNSVQTSRKAIVQTLFKEFRDLPLTFLLARSDKVVPCIQSIDAIPSAEAGVVPASAFTRGSIVEVDVTLAVAPVFRLGTMMTEWTAMAKDFPEMFGMHGNLSFLRDAQPVMRVLERFLAGLIPIKATAVNHVVVEVSGQEYIVHRDAIRGLEIPTRPLFVVGVTEHLGYWKDIRRVLFSEGRFTVLCRVARDGLQTSWTPVKLADMFGDVAPTLVDQINAMEFTSDVGAGPTQRPGQHDATLLRAMEFYREAVLGYSEVAWQEGSRAEFDRLRRRFGGVTATASVQREAFDAVRQLVERGSGDVGIDPATDASARREARERAGLSLFPMLSPATARPVQRSSTPGPREALLDVEVVAIYW